MHSAVKLLLSHEVGVDPSAWPTIVDIQNVAEYVFANDDHLRPLRLRDLPCCLSPWPSARFAFIAPAGKAGFGEIPVAPLVSCDRDGEGWTLRINAQDVARWGFRLDEGGALAAEQPIAIEFRRDFAEGFTGEFADSTFLSRVTLRLIVLPVLMANSFLACKNVRVQSVAERQTRQERRHGPPALTYKVLDIAPMMRVLDEEGDVQRNGLRRALHICRGHFAHYSPEHPLFGKYAGTFWRPQHVRGDIKRGAVVKDYALTTRGGPVGNRDL